MRVLFVFFLILPLVMSMYDPSNTDKPSLEDDPEGFCRTTCPTVSQICTRRNHQCMKDCISIYAAGLGDMEYLRREMEKYMAEHFPNHKPQ